MTTSHCIIMFGQLSRRKCDMGLRLGPTSILSATQADRITATFAVMPTARQREVALEVAIDASERVLHDAIISCGADYVLPHMRERDDINVTPASPVRTVMDQRNRLVCLARNIRPRKRQDDDGLTHRNLEWAVKYAHEALDAALRAQCALQEAQKAPEWSQHALAWWIGEVIVLSTRAVEAAAGPYEFKKEVAAFADHICSFTA